MANVVSELSIEQYIEAIREYDPEMVKKCVDAGIDVKKLMTSHKATCNALSIRAGAATGRGKLQRALSALTAEYKSGIIIGSSDRYDKRAPIKITMLCPDGSICELSTFDARATIDGRKVDIVYPSIAKIMVEREEKWNSLNIKEFMSMEPVSREDLVAVLDTIALTPGQVGVPNEKSTVVVKGIISGVTPTPILSFDENENRYFRNGDFEVLEAPTGPKEAPGIPCLGFRIAAEKDSYGATNFVTASIGKQRYGTPYIGISDVKPLCDGAMSYLPDDPREQAAYVANGVKGIVIYAVGYMGTVRGERNDNYENVNYINLNATCIVDSGVFIGADGQVVALSDFAASKSDAVALSAPAPAPAPAPEVIPAPPNTNTNTNTNTTTTTTPKLPPLAKPATAAEAIASKNEGTITVTRIRNQIIGFCKVSGVTPDKLNVAELQPVIMDGKVPVEFIEVVLADLVNEAAVQSAKL